ncbi:cdkn1a interacting zinc finger protein 1b isoform X2 [Dunckerocampus dactyliophorus]|uniref:cdkn1a interacting zinc finger protein 1b isoform X2 n=1 Tax=Dunckerocampus dactyliophorus TaxID=161453 RepID=UPI0024067255|nr:cdkn1a interacting zinc finger protein 1b isoform X2 [Dunckerocampus dactyliophorus]
MGKMSSSAEEAAGPTNGDEPAGSRDEAGHGGHPCDHQGAAELCDANRTAELHSAGSLKVTIQQSSDCREFARRDKMDDRLRCHVCGVTFSSMQAFEVHMTGSDHMTKVKAITRSIGVSAHALLGRRRRWCDTCQTHFTGDIILHRRSRQHKVCKRDSRPFCAACTRHFKSPRKLVEHMKSAKHKRAPGGGPGGGAYHCGRYWLL